MQWFGISGSSSSSELFKTFFDANFVWCKQSYWGKMNPVEWHQSHWFLFICKTRVIHCNLKAVTGSALLQMDFFSASHLCPCDGQTHFKGDIMEPIWAIEMKIQEKMIIWTLCHAIILILIFNLPDWNCESTLRYHNNVRTWTVDLWGVPLVPASGTFRVNH